MKTLNRYILEKFQITKDSKPLYKYYPETKDELREILVERLAKDKDANLNDIDVSKIDNMEQLFCKLDPHNIKIDQWDVSNVKDMCEMFLRCKNFEGKGLENWKIPKVENMEAMFYFCESFNCNLSDWDVSNVEIMKDLFCYCKKFEGEGLENWTPIKCTNMYDMFYGCDSLNNKPSWYKH